MPQIKKQTTLATKTPLSTNGKPLTAVDRIKPIGFDDDEGIKLLVYGVSGSGKTRTWSTFPKPILAMIVSGGNKSGELRSIDTPENRASINSVTLQNSVEILELVEHARKGDYATVVLDHASGLQDMVLAEILGLDQIPVQKTWGLAQQQDYGQTTLQCKELLRAVLDLPCNVVVVAQERSFNAEEGVTSDVIAPTVGAALMPKLAGWLNTACDYVCETYKRGKTKEKKITVGEGKSAQTRTIQEREKGVDFFLRTGPDQVVMTKFRTPPGHVLPDEIKDPSYEKIMQVIRGGRP